MEELYPSKNWKKIFAPEKVIHSTKDIRQEVLWVNYNTCDLSHESINNKFLFD
jgi:DNA adenine methylase